MFKRKIYSELLTWKESLKIKKRALVIKGLRQVGKTTIVKNFCQENYENVVYINFMDNNTIKKIFDNDLIIDNIIRDLSAALPESRFIPNKTVIIFDELQECSNARASIKPFMLDGRFDIVATGSLIGLRGYNKKKSKGIPTGFEKTITMKAMDFEEYLWAKGIKEESISYIRSCFYKHEKVSEVVNDSMLDYFKEYLCVGGMPDVVNTFLITHDLNQVYDIQSNILEDYKDDFGKHLDEEENTQINKTELTKIMEVYNSIPNQLAKENKKFQYSVISKNAKGREYRNAITWLEEFGLISLCYNLSVLELPLEGNKIDDIFKVYVADTGLFMAMLEKGSVNNVLNGDLKIYKGAIFENIIADAFHKLGKKLYYYKKDSGIEVDFITRFDNVITAIEVKATNGNAKSLKEITSNKEKYNVTSNFKLIDGNIGSTGSINTIPLYMAFLINE
ncbi:MAG: ATP-binding protein [Erysipelotrichales bacterium]|nr:ATP-binding protein [Erysipelotrichales bacterium]